MSFKNGALKHNAVKFARFSPYYIYNIYCIYIYSLYIISRQNESEDKLASCGGKSTTVSHCRWCDIAISRNYIIIIISHLCTRINIITVPI
jgi:hypothetical protein